MGMMADHTEVWGAIRMRNFPAAINGLEVNAGAICADAPLPANTCHIGES